jgi:hypothetical protein
MKKESNPPPPENSKPPAPPAPPSKRIICEDVRPDLKAFQKLIMKRARDFFKFSNGIFFEDFKTGQGKSKAVK